MKKKHVLIVTTISATIKGFLIPHIDYLISRGYKVSIATKINYSDIEFLSMLDLRKVDYYDVEFSRNPLDFYKINQAIKDMNNLKNNISFTHIYTHTPIASFITRYVFRKSPSRVVYFAHGLHFYDGAPAFNWLFFYPLEIIALRWTDIVITINKEDYSRLAKLNKCKVIKIPGVGLDSAFVEKINKKQSFNQLVENTGLNDFVKEENFVLIVIGELNENKNQIMFLKAINKLINVEKYDNIRCLIVGKGPLKKKLLHYIDEHDLGEYVRLLGYRKDVAELLKLSDVLVSMSQREGLPVNVIEAMYAEKCVILTDIRGHRDLVANEDTLIKINNDSVYTLTNLIKKYMKFEDLRKSEAQKNKNMSKKYLIDDVLKSLNEIFI